MPAAFMKNILATRACLITLACVLLAQAGFAKTPTTIYSFSGPDGETPNGWLVQGRDGNLYGTTKAGGAHSGGTVFKITPAGALTTLYHFCSKSLCADGENPEAGLVLGADGNFYGTTYSDGNTAACGAPGCGTVFKITPAGAFTTLHVFCSLSSCTDGANPYGGLVQGTDGNLYGTTSSFGAYTQGTVFKISTGGKLTTLYSFNVSDGASPFCTLVRGVDGNLYGTTSSGGTGGDGTVFSITPGGSLTTLHNFSGPDGSTPYGGLTLNKGTVTPTFWGTTSTGGTAGNGTVYSITASGTFTLIHSFCPKSGCPDGGTPLAGISQLGGTAWGTTVYGGVDNFGTIFEVNSSGFTKVADFTDGFFPEAPPLLHTNGNRYGTTSLGGAGGVGTIYTLCCSSTHVSFVGGSGTPGQTAEILGQGLKGVSKVAFFDAFAKQHNAGFTVHSDTYLTAVIPSGSATEVLNIFKPKGLYLISFDLFYVTPKISSFTPTSGPPGTSVTITGDAFLILDSVLIGGAAAKFTALAPTSMTVTVPAAATTGKIVITTDGGVATSAATFTVTP